uniref:Uncharacterized protein n=1 Tax=Cannabis sativa TaxID=3483 RepID=A0A803QSI8_CANSA
MKHNIMRDKVRVSIVNHFSPSKVKTQFLNGELHAFCEDINGRLIQTQYERQTLRMSFVDHNTRPYKETSRYLADLLQVQAMADVFEEYLKTIDTVICKLQFLLSVASLLPSSLISDHESRLLYQFSTNITQCRRGLTVAFIQSLNQDIQKWMDEK